ncbi:MAG: PD-(D/E)XK nuclease family protein, partial [Rhodomicrobium sp.]|nr:PD-(D/E)XK nuclease family protein [Rhodomicrobium sp.]
AILGQADRILLKGSEVTVFDYKSGALPAGSDLQRHHLAQLACYRFALQRIYANTNIRAVLLHTGSGTVTEAANEALDAALDEILGTL